jgi:glutamate 5-kinase
VYRPKANFWLLADGSAQSDSSGNELLWGRKAIGTAKSQRTELSPREQVAAAARIVVKIGTNVLMRDDGGVSIGAFYGIAESLANFRRAGREVLLVSSGAVGLGVQRLELSARPSELALVQACAAVGQSRLMSMYDDAFEKLGFRVAQVLLTEDDFLDSRRHENLRATLTTLLQLGVIPVINENDTVSTVELDSPAGPQREQDRVRVFGDNDKLSALVMTHIDADLLVLLSDVDGLYTDDPQSAGATLIPELDSLDETIRAYARGGNGRGRGGMETKLEAVRIANEDGRPAIIANGRTPGVLDAIVAGKPVGTLFFPRKRL